MGSMMYITTGTTLFDFIQQYDLFEKTGDKKVQSNKKLEFLTTAQRSFCLQSVICDFIENFSLLCHIALKLIITEFSNFENLNFEDSET